MRPRMQMRARSSKRISHAQNTSSNTNASSHRRFVILRAWRSKIESKSDRPSVVNSAFCVQVVRIPPSVRLSVRLGVLQTEQETDVRQKTPPFGRPIRDAPFKLFITSLTPAFDFVLLLLPRREIYTEIDGREGRRMSVMSVAELDEAIARRTDGRRTEVRDAAR